MLNLYNFLKISVQLFLKFDFLEIFGSFFEELHLKPSKMNYIQQSVFKHYSIQEELESERQVSSDLEQQYSHVQSQLRQLHQKLWQQQLRQQQQAKQTYTQTVNSHLVQDGNKTQSGQPIAWQQRRNMENDGQTRQQKSDPLKKTMKVLAQNSGSTAGGQIKKTGIAVSSYYDKNSQQNSDVSTLTKGFLFILIRKTKQNYKAFITPQIEIMNLDTKESTVSQFYK
jgi:hypothetical protein